MNRSIDSKPFSCYNPKKNVKADEIINRFHISARTLYNYVKALLEAGVPIGSEAGTGYIIVDGQFLLL